MRGGKTIQLAFVMIGALVVAAQAEGVRLVSPVRCAMGRDCVIQNYFDHGKSGEARDYQCGSLTYPKHDGTDFRLRDMAAQRAGVDVLAAAEGVALRVRDGVPDLGAAGAAQSRARGQECGNGVVVAHGDGWETQYCHLAQGSLRVKPGDRVAAGQPLGRIGASGRAEFPHLHFTARQDGKAVDPFAYGAAEDACGGGVPLWEPALRETFVYRERMVLNAGFTSRSAVSMEMVETGETGEKPRPEDAAALVAFVRVVGLRAGDAPRLRVTGPDGRALADGAGAPLDRDKAQYLTFTGARRPPEGWPAGRYLAEYSVSHDGKNVLELRFDLYF